MIATIATAFIGVCIGIIITSCVYMWYYPLKNAKTPMSPPQFPVPTVTFKEIRESDRIEEEYEAQKKVLWEAEDRWYKLHKKVNFNECSIREAVAAESEIKEAWRIFKAEEKKFADIKQKFKEAIAKETQPSRPHKGISLEQILAIPRCGGYDDDHIRKLFGNRHYVIPQTIADADIPAEDKLWALFHLMGTGRKHRLAMEACARVNITWFAHSFTNNTLWDAIRTARHRGTASNPYNYWEELQWQLKRAVELMEESD